MSLHEDVRNAVTAHTTELYLLLEFVRDVDKYIIGQAEERIQDMVDMIPANVKAEMTKMFSDGLKALKELERAKKESPSTVGKRRLVKLKGDYSPEAREHLGRFLYARQKSIRYPNLLYSVALTHAIAVFESFLGDFLIAIYTNRPDTLKSQNIATYEDILSFRSMKELTRHLATTKADKVLDDNIDKVAAKLGEGFNFDVSRFKQFKIIREASYRRNIVVHNGGITDKDYCEKIAGAQIGVTLSTDFKYIETLTTVIGRFIDHLDRHFSRKMHYMRHPKQNSILYPP